MSASLCLFRQLLLEAFQHGPALLCNRRGRCRIGCVQIEQPRPRVNARGRSRQKPQLGRTVFDGLGERQTTADRALGNPVGEADSSCLPNSPLDPGTSCSCRCTLRRSHAEKESVLRPSPTSSNST